MMKYAVTTALLLCAGAAQAGGPVEVVTEAPVAVEAQVARNSGDWTGYYLGISALSGYAWQDTFSNIDAQAFGLQVGYLRDFGRFVVGGELAYTSGETDDSVDFTSAQLRLVGGYDAGRVLPYGFIGVSNIDALESETMAIYGLGAKLAVVPRIAVGLEYYVQRNNDIGGSGTSGGLNMWGLRVDYRF